MRNLVALFILFLLPTSPVLAHDVVYKQLPHAKQVGKGRFSILKMGVYEATLYAPKGKWDKTKPYALSIHYFRKIKGADIAKRSVEEMKKQGFSDEKTLANWHEKMSALFPDVKNGSELIAVFTPLKSTDFYADGKLIGSIDGAEFATHFFNIWLSEKTSDPKLRKKLLGHL